MKDIHFEENGNNIPLGVLAAHNYLKEIAYQGREAHQDYFCDLIHTELRNQYVVGYSSSNQTNTGKWRKIKVRLDPPEGLPKLKIRHRQGYFPRKN